MKKDFKHLLTPSLKWKNSMPHSNSQLQSSHPPQSMICQRKRIIVFNVKNQDTLLNIVLTLGAMNVTNVVISSWTAHTENLPELQWYIRRHTMVTMPNWVWGTTMKIDTDEADLDHSPTTKDIAAWTTASCKRGCSRSQNWDRHSHQRSSSWWSCLAYRGHSHRPFHDHTTFVTLQIIYTSQLFGLSITRSQ